MSEFNKEQINTPNDFKTLLLLDQSGPKDAIEPVLSRIPEESAEAMEFSNYIEKIFQNHSVRTISKILEINNSTSKKSILKVGLSGKYDLKTIYIGNQPKAIINKPDSDSVVVTGDEFKFPDINDSFDAIVLTNGAFGLFLQEKTISNFLQHVYDYLQPNGLIIGESYNITGAFEDAFTKTGHRNWLQYKEVLADKKQLLVTRLTVSHIDIENGIMNISIRFILDNLDSPYETKTTLEAFAIRLFSFSELTGYLRKKFHRVRFYQPNTLEPIELKTFKFTFIAEKR